jgi:hypothetical protein
LPVFEEQAVAHCDRRVERLMLQPYVDIRPTTQTHRIVPKSLRCARGGRAARRSPCSGRLVLPSSSLAQHSSCRAHQRRRAPLSPPRRPVEASTDISVEVGRGLRFLATDRCDSPHASEQSSGSVQRVCEKLSDDPTLVATCRYAVASPKMRQSPYEKPHFVAMS